MSDDVFDSVMSKPAAAAGQSSMTVGADGIPRITISGLDPVSKPAEPDPFASVMSGAPMPADAPAAAPAPAAKKGLLDRALDVVDPLSPLLGVDRGAALKGVATGFADMGKNLIGRMRESVPAATPGALIQPPAAGEDRTAGLDDFAKAAAADAPGSFGLGRVAGNIAATAPLSAGLTGAVPAALGMTPAAVGPTLPGLVPRAIDAIRSVPYLGRVAGPVANVIPQSADAALNAYTTTAAVDPEHAGTGAVIGALTPPVVNSAIRGGTAVGGVLRSMMQGNASRDAAAILRAGGVAEADIPAAIAKLRGGATDAAGVPLAPHQILYDPANPETAGFSQLARNLRNAGQTGLSGIETQQNAARQAILDRLSPNTGTVADAATDFGNVAQPSIAMKNADALQGVRDAFNAVDPAGETKLHLPLDAMEAELRAKFPNATLGAKGAPQATGLLNLFRSIGETPVDFAPGAAGKVTQAESTLAQAVRRAGGINAGNESGRAFGGELAALNETTSGLVNKGRGQDVDKLAERLHEAGFLPDSDPATLIEALHYEGKTRLSNAADMDALYNKAREAAQQGDMPTGSVAVPNELPFAQVQQVRSMLAEAARKIENGPTGATAESTALRAMKRQLDAHVAAVADGQGAAAEHFPSDVADRYYSAIQKKIDQANTFTKGPQSVALRPNAELTAGQLAGKFYNATGGQGGAMDAFSRIEDPQLRNLLRGYAVAGMRNTSNAAGNLTSKLGDFNDARSVANRALFTPAELDKLDALSAGIQKTTAADAANVAKGSPTAQNIQTAMNEGLWGHPLVTGAAAKVPVLKHGLVPLVGGLGKLTQEAKVARLGSLMSDPAALADAMQSLERFRGAAGVPLVGSNVTPGLLLAAPGVVAAGGR